MKRKSSQCFSRTGATVILLLAFILICNAQTRPVASDIVKKSQIIYTFPLKNANPGKYYLTDSNNKPFFWLGDAAWSLIAQLSNEDVCYYLDNRKENGFSVLLVSLIEHKFCSGAPADFYKDLPFTGKPFATPNEKYFKHADFVIKAASQQNLMVLLAPLYLGYGCGDEGWCAEVRAATIDDLYSWGKFLGRRYKNYNNIIWCIGGDTDPSPVREKVLAMVRGIREYDTIALFSAHNRPETMAITPWKEETWLTINNVYSYDSLLYPHFKDAYELKPQMPFYLCESAYENEHQSTPSQLRSQAYQALLCGAMGHIFGNCPVWHFGANKSWCNKTDWKRELENAGSLSMYNFQRLFRSREWYDLIPDFDHEVVTAGFGSWGKKDYVTAAVTGDGVSIIAYLPSSRTVSVNLEKLSCEKVLIWWYDPSAGRAIYSGIYRAGGSKEFTPPSEGDWVLIIDNASSPLPEPGRILETEN
jgi:hypothetical protein